MNNTERIAEIGTSDLLKAAQCIYLACEQPVADDISAKLNWAAAKIDQLNAQHNNDNCRIFRQVKIKEELDRELEALETENARLTAELEAKETINRLYMTTLSMQDSKFRDVVKRNVQLSDELEQKTRELERHKEQWTETASDNTNYVLAYADGIYCVTDAWGAPVCEFIREAALSALGVSE